MDKQAMLRGLLDREAIRELGMLYSRAVDRGDVALLRTLYTDDATDTHGDTFDGTAADYCDFIAQAVPHMAYSGHHICNHLIALSGDTAEGEIYAIACHVVPDGKGGMVEDVRWVRYIDRYRRDDASGWRFAKRVVNYDHQTVRPTKPPANPGSGAAEPSYAALSLRLFARGPRA